MYSSTNVSKLYIISVFEDSIKIGGVLRVFIAEYLKKHPKYMIVRIMHSTFVLIF